MYQIKTQIVFINFLEIAVSLLHNYVELIEVFGIRRIDNVDELNYAWMRKLSHEANLPYNSLAVCYIFENVKESLDCDLLSGLNIKCFSYFAIAS